MSLLSGNEELRDFMDKLAVSNVSRHIELPMIAVMGDTSSGKSSLLTSISMVELPSSEKLTTRCPIMLQMKRAKERTAEVSVQWKERSRLPDDRPADGDVTFHKSVDDTTWDELTGYIAAAQDHIMKIMSKTGANDVARDIVKVKVTGPNCEDLTLIDLPGIVRSTGAGESATLVQDIQSLIDEYLTNSRCVILAVHPANVDFHNSQIMADAKKVDPETKRTLPVITKPDLIDSGAEEGVKDLLLGLKTEKFEKGFHMVKGRGQKALNDKQSIEESLELEDSFFQHTLPWRNVDNRRLFGTKELRVKLGELQIQLVRDTFPDIKREMASEKHKAEEELRVLGEMCETIADKRNFYLDLIRRIDQEIEDLVHGRNARPSLKRKRCTLAGTFHDFCDEFKTKIAKCRFSDGVSEVQVGDKVIVRDADRREWKAKVTKWISKDEVEVCYDDDDDDDHCYVTKTVAVASVRRASDWIQEILSDNRSLDVPIFPNPSVFNLIVSNYIEDVWEKHCHDLLDSVTQLLKEAVNDVLASEKRVGRYPRLLAFLRNAFEEILNHSFTKSREALCDYIDKEKKPFTQNDYLSETISRLRAKPLEIALLEGLGISDGSGFIGNQTLTKSQIKTTVEAIFAQNRKKSLEEHTAEDMQYALDAYGKVAFKRFADEVPKICKQVLENHSRNAEKPLLVLPAERKLDELICESPDSKSRYEALRQKVEDLEEGLKIIEGLAF